MTYREHLFKLSDEELAKILVKPAQSYLGKPSHLYKCTDGSLIEGYDKAIEKQVFILKKQLQHTDIKEGAMTHLDKVLKAIELHETAANTAGQDADTVLSDIVSNCDAEELGMGIDALTAWKNSKDRESVEDMFFAITGHTFKDYVDSIIE